MASRTAGEVLIADVGESKPELADFMVLHEGGILFRGSVSELLANEDEYVKDFLAQTLPPW